MTATWPEVPLGEVLTRVERFERRDDAAEYRFAGTYSFARGIFTRPPVSGSSFRLGKVQRVRAGDFVYCKIMAWEGAFGLVPANADDHVMSGAFVAYEPCPYKVVPKFLDWYFKVPHVWREIGAPSTGTNIRRRSLHPSEFEKARIPLPPLPEQRRIVARIEELATQIREAEVPRHLAAEESDALAQAAIAKKLSDGDSRGWRKVRFSESAVLDVIDGDRGKNYPQKADFAESGDCLFLNTGNVRKGRFSFSRCDFISRQKDAALRKGKLLRGDVILTTRGTLGNFAHYDDTVPFEHIRINSGMVILRPVRDILLPQYLQVVLGSPAFEDQVSALLSGSAQSQLPVNKLARIDFFLPALAEQRRIAAESDALQTKVDELKRLQAETQAELDALLPSILDRAFKGKL